MEADDILVCPVTDPSWVSLMMLAGALVIDIGAAGVVTVLERATRTPTPSQPAGRDSAAGRRR